MCPGFSCDSWKLIQLCMVCWGCFEKDVSHCNSEIIISSSVRCFGSCTTPMSTCSAILSIFLEKASHLSKSSLFWWWWWWWRRRRRRRRWWCSKSSLLYLYKHSWQSIIYIATLLCCCVFSLVFGDTEHHVDLYSGHHFLDCFMSGAIEVQIAMWFDKLWFLYICVCKHCRGGPNVITPHLIKGCAFASRACLGIFLGFLLHFNMAIVWSSGDGRIRSFA